MTRLVIRNERELLAAMTRAEELEASPGSDAASREQRRIAEAIRRYEETVTMMTDVADKAAEDSSNEVAGISGAE